MVHFPKVGHGDIGRKSNCHTNAKDTSAILRHAEVMRHCIAKGNNTKNKFQFKKSPFSDFWRQSRSPGQAPWSGELKSF